jgi:hypothetical protein
MNKSLLFSKYTMINPATVNIATPNGTLTISKIVSGVAYDQHDQVKPNKFFRFEPDVLSQEWVKPDEDKSIIVSKKKNELVSA